MLFGGGHSLAGNQMQSQSPMAASSPTERQARASLFQQLSMTTKRSVRRSSLSFITEASGHTSSTSPTFQLPRPYRACCRDSLIHRQLPANHGMLCNGRASSKVTVQRRCADFFYYFFWGGAAHASMLPQFAVFCSREINLYHSTRTQLVLAAIRCSNLHCGTTAGFHPFTNTSHGNQCKGNVI